MPTCSICALEKEPDAFYADKRKKGGLRSECKDCAEEFKRRAAPPSVVEAIIATQEQPRLPAPPEEKLNAAIEMRMQYYACGGLDALWDLANMKMSENSGLMQVKYLAALRLAGPPAGSPTLGDGKSTFDDTLKSLNDLFHKKAPRLREIRERVATFDDGSQERVVSEG